MKFLPILPYNKHLLVDNSLNIISLLFIKISGKTVEPGNDIMSISYQGMVKYVVSIQKSSSKVNLINSDPIKMQMCQDTSNMPNLKGNGRLKISIRLNMSSPPTSIMINGKMRLGIFNTNFSAILKSVNSNNQDYVAEFSLNCGPMEFDNLKSVDSYLTIYSITVYDTNFIQGNPYMFNVISQWDLE